MAYGLSDFARLAVSVALTSRHDDVLGQHLHKANRQEDLTFAYWKPSRGLNRFTAVITKLVLPEPGERILQGNVAFRSNYFLRVLKGIPEDHGIAFMHGHLSPGYQGMSGDDIVAERDRIAGPVAGRTKLPLVGLTRGTDGAWSGRFWLRRSRHTYHRRAASAVRVVGRKLSITYPIDVPEVRITKSQVATLSVWGQSAQEKLARTKVGIVGLGSVGSLVAETLCRVGMQNLTFIDFDRIEHRNLDRTIGAVESDVGLAKVEVAARNARSNSTSETLKLRVVPDSVLSHGGLSEALDCDVLFSCVDRPWARFMLNSIAYCHLIPVIDGGIYSGVQPDGQPLHVAWRIHTVGPGNACMICVGALRRGHVSMDRAGLLDDPDYIDGLSPEMKAAFSRRNVFPFSMSVAAHEVLQFVRLVTGLTRVGGIGPQIYNGFPGVMTAQRSKNCEDDCEFNELTATAKDLHPNLDR